MKRFKLDLNKMKAVVVGSIATGALLSTSVFATENVEFELRASEEYKAWADLSEEEKSQVLMPNPNVIVTPEEVLKNYAIDNHPSMLKDLLGNVSGLEDTVGNARSSKYDLNDKLNLRVEHQGNTNECWAFSIVKSLETNLALKNNTRNLDNFSERHMDYATSKTFKDGINPIGYHREVGEGGLFPEGLAYLTNGTGAVKESDMPFEDNESKINLSEIDKKVDTIVTEFAELPSINKSYIKDANGNTTKVTYKDASGKTLSMDEVNALRNIIKEHIVANGAIPAMTAANQDEFYDTPGNVFKAKNYNCNSTVYVRDHAITIVGWDDNYSKDNFVEGHKPSTNGAYKILNTYGENSFDNGYLYISYEDFFIESELYGVISTGKVDYSKIYQHDFFGGVYSIGSKSTGTGYYGVSYDRDKNVEETLSKIAVTTCDYADLEIYLNEQSGEFDPNKLIKVGSFTNVQPGYHRFDVRPTKLTGDSYSIVVRQKSTTGTFYFEIEANIPNTGYSDVKSDGKSVYSLDAKTWSKISNLKINGVNMDKSDVCIKAFTTTSDFVQEEPEDKPGSDKPAEDKPTQPDPGNQPSEDKPSEPVIPVGPSTDDPGKDKPTEDKPTEDKPTEDKPTEDKPAEDKPAEDKPANTDPIIPIGPSTDEPGKDQPAEDKPTEDKPTQEDPSKNDKITITNYKLLNGTIYNVKYETKRSDFVKNVKSELKFVILDENDNEIESEKALIKTGYKLKLSDGTTYEIIVRGDVNNDGRVTLTDVVKVLFHYNENKGYTLDGSRLKAADLNVDGKVNLQDVSLEVFLYNEI